MSDFIGADSFCDGTELCLTAAPTPVDNTIFLELDWTYRKGAGPKCRSIRQYTIPSPT